MSASGPQVGFVVAKMSCGCFVFAPLGAHWVIFGKMLGPFDFEVGPKIKSLFDENLNETKKNEVQEGVLEKHVLEMDF